MTSSPPLPAELSPCANVRRTCYALMSDKPCFETENRFETENAATVTTKQDCVGGGVRSVILHPSTLKSLAETIATSIVSDASGKQRDKECSSEQSQPDPGGHGGSIIEKCLDSDGFEFASWDAEDWHYTGKSYSRPHLSQLEEQKQRYERVALYTCFLDCINFCFWPVDDERDEEEARGIQQSARNLLEYEHLAIALKNIAEEDDNLSSDSALQMGSTQFMSGLKLSTSSPPSPLIQAEDSYALAPQNLIKLSPSWLIDKIAPYLPNSTSHTKEKGESIYKIPNVEERTRLIIELSQSLLTFHSGSATMLISKSQHSADRLVHLILQTCPGFRDTAIDGYQGRWIAFYKRAQILCADLWAALGNGQHQNNNTGTNKINTTTITHGRSDSVEDGSIILDYCHFRDMDNITTFADYRVPQLLRHLGVLVYSPHLEVKVDNGVELMPCSADELYIRAGTVVAVDLLVNLVRSKLQLISKQEDGDHRHGTASSSIKLKENLWTGVNSVKLDWYLWNIGEKLDREGLLKKHHLVRTIFY